MNRIIVFALNALICFNAPAQNSTTAITLEACLAAALINHPEIKTAENETAIAGLSINLARSARYASINAEFSGGYSNRYEAGNDYRNAYARLTADQLLWQNKRVSSSIDRARYLSTASKANYKALEQEIIVKVKTAYYSCQQQNQLYLIARDNVAKSEMFLDYARERYQLGIGRKSDILKAESDLSGALFDRDAYLNSFHKTQNELSMLTGLPVEELLLPENWNVDTLIFRNAFADSIIAIALSNFPELQAAYQFDLSQFARIAERKAVLYPGLSINTGYEWNYNPLLQEQKGWYAMITLKWNLFSGNEKQTMVQTEILNKENSKNQIDNTRIFLIKEIRNKLIDLIEAYDQINLTQSLMKTTAENLEIAKEQFKTGSGSMLELADARIIDLSATQENIRAITNYRIAIANLERLTGKTIQP